jgi:hypothetical protein
MDEEKEKEFFALNFSIAKCIDDFYNHKGIPQVDIQIAIKSLSTVLSLISLHRNIPIQDSKDIFLKCIESKYENYGRVI